MLVSTASTKRRSEHGARNHGGRDVLQTGVLFFLATIPGLAQPRSCLAHGVLAYTAKSNPRTIPLSLKVNPNTTLIVSFVPTFGSNHEARYLNVTFHTKTAPDKTLRISTDDLWFGPDKADFDPAPFAMNNQDAPDYEEIRLPQLDLGVRLDMGNNEVSNAPYQFLSLQLDVCIRK